MTLSERLKLLRRELRISQEAVGAQGFVSAPGWIKIENGQRQASEKLIERFCRWLVTDKRLQPEAATGLRDELILLKYLGHASPHVRSFAAIAAKQAGRGDLLAVNDQPRSKPKRGRPPGSTYPKPASQPVLP